MVVITTPPPPGVVVVVVVVVVVTTTPHTPGESSELRASILRFTPVRLRANWAWRRWA